MVNIGIENFPPFLEQEFEKMVVPGDEKGFAISFSSGNAKACVACGLLGERAIAVRYTGEEYKLKKRSYISIEAFNRLCKDFPPELRKSGFIFEEDTLDGDTYLIKWSWNGEKTRLVLANPRQFGDEAFGKLADHIDELMCNL